MFNLLSTRISIQNAVVLDLFCGTGALGLEAISRGAEKVIFVDTNGEVLKLAARNASSLGIEQRCRFLRSDTIRYLRQSSTPKFDLILADPPYGFEATDQLSRFAAAVLNEEGLFVLEHDKRHRFDDEALQTESRSYGRTIVTIFGPSPQHTSNRSEKS